jgi:hypothetical protein
MVPKEKAEKLVLRFMYLQEPNYNWFHKGLGKQCALIAVDEILQNFGTLTEGKQHYAAHCTIQFYEQVKQEIEKL